MRRTSATTKQPAVTALLFATLLIIVCYSYSSSLSFSFFPTVAAAESINNDDDDLNNKKNNNNNGPSQSAGDNNDPNNGHSTNNDSQQYSSPLLDSNSVVLITGAAGFIGHELSLALKRTYNVKKLLLVDHLGMESDNEGVFHGPPPKNDNGDASYYKTKKAYEKYDSDRMSLFELKRRRIFRVFHELTAVNHDLDDTDVIHGLDELQNYKNIESIKFYRADMRPSIPEFFDIGELPLLEGIFGSNPDITHVVHLADDDINNQNQAIPRNRGSAKAGRMEAILEEMRLILERKAAAEASSDDVNGAARLPQLVYASSYEVYDFLSTATKPEYNAGQQHQPNPPPFREDKPITTPSSLHGASKLIDEVLASAYHSTHGIFSVGLRFFPVYGPWSNPGTDVFDLAQELYSQNRGVDDDVENNAAKDDFNRFHEDIKDYVYIDDAVDAIMSAMQYRPLGQMNPPPVVFNVGTGKGSTLKEIRDEMMIHFPPGSFDNDKSPPKHSAERQATISYASTERSKDLLGFVAQVPLSVGIARTLSWLRDHSDPFGNDPEVSAKQKTIDSFLDNSLTKMARDECSPFDRECLRGTPVFPCASECSKPENCTPSAWDDAASLSRLVTRGCDAVMFTILLHKDVDQIPSVIGATSSSFVGADLPDDNVGKRTKARCNIAFVSEDTPLVQRLRIEGEVYSDETDDSLPSMIRHGFWTLIPVKSASSDDWLHTFSGSVSLSSLPKISPGQFFGPSVRHAVFAGPSVLIDDVPQLLTKLRAESSATDSDVAMIVTEKRQACDASVRGSICPWTMPENNDSIQRNMHNMVRVALKGDMLGGGLGPIIDSSFIAHSLHGEEARMLRCDVYSEATQWGASSDERSLEFILSLHDFWSRAGNHWSSVEIESLDTGSSLNTEEDSRLMVLSSSDRQFFAHIATPGSMGIIHL